MTGLKRITLGRISELIDESEVFDSGIGIIKGSRYKKSYLLSRSPLGTRKLHLPVEIWFPKRDKFLEYIDKLLIDSELYIAEAEYREESYSGFIPHKLRGRFYREKRSN